MIKNLHQDLLFRLLLFFLFSIASWSAWGQTADLEIHGTAYHNQNAGSITTFTLYVTNNGPDDATGVVMTDTLNSSWNFTSNYNSANYSVSQGTLSATGTQSRELTWTVGTIRNGETAVLVFDATNVYDNSNGSFNKNNSATVSSSSTDNNSGNNTVNLTSTNDWGTHNVIITKTADNENPIQGSIVHFTITINRLSGQNGTSFQVIDKLPSGFTNISGSTATGTYTPSTGVWNFGGALPYPYNATLTITATATTPGDYINVAFISQGGPDTVATNNIASVSGAIQATNGNEADLTITKTGARQNYDGGVATFNIALTNNGPDEATDVKVSDFLDSGWSFPSPYENYLVTEGTVTYTPGNKKFVWEIDSLPVGETAYFTYTVDNIGGGGNQHWDNTVTVSSAESDPNTSDNSSSITAANVNGGADIELTKNVTPDDQYIGENVVFTITAQRIESLSGGNADATNVRVLDLLPSGYAYVNHNASAGTYDESTGVWTIGTINSDAARTLEITATALASGDYENTAVLFHDKPDPDVTNQIATATIEDPIPDPLGTDLSITKEVDENNPTVMTNVVFTLTATNNGDNDTTGVVVTDLLPSGYEYVSDDGSGAYDESTGEWTIGNLNDDTSATLHITAKVLETGNYNNTATIAGDGSDTVPGNNSASQSVTPYFPSADLEITSIIINDGSPTVGDNVIFTINVKNNGIDAASGVLVNALLPSGYQYVSSTPPSGTTYNSSTGVWTIGNMAVDATKSITITAKVLATGAYAFNAEISGAVDDPNTDNNTLPEDVTLTNLIDLAITKTVDEDEPGISDPVVFTIEVENVGTTNATGVVVTDVIPNGYNYVDNSIAEPQVIYDASTRTLTWNVGNLDVGNNAQLTINTTARAGGTHNNIATVSANEGDENADDNSDSASVEPDLGDARDLKVVQSVDNEAPNLGNNVTFTITATNEGPLVTTGVSVNTLLGNGLQYVSNTNPTTGSFDSGTRVWTIGGMANGATATLTITATALDDMGAAYLSIAEITGNEIDFDNNIVNNKAYSILSPVGQTFFPCEVNAETPAFYEDFGSGEADYAPELEPGRTNMIYMSGVNIEDGEYTVAKNAQLGYDNWQDISDPSGDPNGYFMIVNADIDPYEFFRTRITLSEEFCTNTRYNIDFKMINVNSTANHDYCTGPDNPGSIYIEPEIGYFVINDKGEILGAGTSGKIPYQPTAEWVPQNFVFISGQDDQWVELVLFNKAPGGCGNDLAIDDISISACMTPPIRLIKEISTTNEEVCGGETVTLKVDYEEDGNYVWPPTAWGDDLSDVQYQWQRSDDGINFTDISGETTDKYIIEDFQEEDQAYYRLMYAQTGNIDKVFCRFPSEQFYPVFNAVPVLQPIESITGVNYVCPVPAVPGEELQLTNDYDFSDDPDDPLDNYDDWEDVDWEQLGEDEHHYAEWTIHEPYYASEDTSGASDTGEATLTVLDDNNVLITAVSAGTVTIYYTVWSPKGTCHDWVKMVINVMADCPTCVEDPTSEVGGVTSPIGISTYKEQLNGWPENISNGYIVLESGSKGFVITRVADEGAITEPKEGMLIYDEEDDCVKLYYSSEWHCIDQDCD